LGKKFKRFVTHIIKIMKLLYIKFRIMHNESTIWLKFDLRTIYWFKFDRFTLFIDQL